MNSYPAFREADVVLRDGSTVQVRPVRNEDQAALVELLSGLSPESLYLRFFTGAVDVKAAARWAADVDYRDRYGFVAVAGTDRRIAGHAGYNRTGPDRAEISFVLSEQFQGRGLGTILLAHLAEVAGENGIDVFEAEVLPANHRMIEVFRDSGFQVGLRSGEGVIRVDFPTSVTSAAFARFTQREQTAAVAAIRNFLQPRGVAVVGASRRRGSIGGEVFNNLISTGFNGPVYPVNPKAEFVQSIVTYPSVNDCPGQVDLAVIVVPGPAVVDVARDCARKGVRALVVISAGFSETGPEGLERQRELLQICRSAGMRLIGPNCMGILNTSADVRLNATFAPAFPPTGRVAFSSQSGALGLAVIDYANELGLGISSFVSVGNKADISGNDLLQYWETDDDTDLVLLYLESFGNPRRFARIAREVGRRKPIIAVKSGRSAAGARATSSHTGALIAASDVTVDALFQQAGVIRTDTLSEMFGVASLIANQPPPPGRRVAILTNAGGPGILCADACEARGLDVVALPEQASAAMREFLPAEASVSNPVDMIASATGEDYRRSIEAIAACEEIDALIVIFIPPLVTSAEEVARAIRDATTAMNRKIPILSVFMSKQGVPAELQSQDVRIPSYSFPEDAARALARAADYGVWRSTPDGTVPVFAATRRDEAHALIAGALSEGPRWLRPLDVANLFSCYGLPMAEWRLAKTPQEAARVAEHFGVPVAVKAVSDTLVHKTEVGAVRLGLQPDEVGAAAEEIAARVKTAGHKLEGLFVQKMVTGGAEMIVGVVHDQSFGPVVACGAGGTAVELLKDVQVRITPLTDRDAREMIHSLATYPLLTGFRGAQRLDVGALEDILLRVGILVENHPEITEMDCNPVIVLSSGAVIVDARVRVEVADPALSLRKARPGLGVARSI